MGKGGVGLASDRLLPKSVHVLSSLALQGGAGSHQLLQDRQLVCWWVKRGGESGAGGGGGRLRLLGDLVRVLVQISALRTD